jgi:hypothetical protein
MKERKYVLLVSVNAFSVVLFKQNNCICKHVVCCCENRFFEKLHFKFLNRIIRKISE